MQEIFFTKLVGWLSNLFEVLSQEPEEADEFLISLWRDAAVFCFLKASCAFKCFLVEVFDDPTLLQYDKEGLDRLEDAVAFFVERGFLSEDQFWQMGSLIGTSMVLLRDRNNIPADVYEQKVKELFVHCELLADFCEKISIHSEEEHAIGRS